MSNKIRGIVIFVFFVLLFVHTTLSHLNATEIRKSDYDSNGRTDYALIAQDKAIVFLSYPDGYSPAAYLKDSDGNWFLLAESGDFVSLKGAGSDRFNISKKFDKVIVKKGSSLTATGLVSSPDGAKYMVFLDVRPEKLAEKTVFVFDYTWKNIGQTASKDITIPVNFELALNYSDSYFFSPGIFYKNNELTPEMLHTDVNIPTLSTITKEGYYTFLADRPMLPLIANWQDNKFFMLATVDSIENSKGAVIRNSMGWSIKNNKLYHNLWTHGYLYNRYTKEDGWSERVDSVTDPTREFKPGESLKQVFFVASGEGDIYSLFDYYKAFRQNSRLNKTRNIYESMRASFITKIKNLDDWYNEDKGYLMHCINARNQLLISWVGGIPSGCSMLYLADYLNEDKKIRDYGLNTIDFIVKNSLSPSGFSYNWYQDGRWGYGGVAANPLYRKGIPARLAAESTFYLLKAYQYETKNGYQHKDWLKHAKSNLDAAVKVYNDSGEFGFEYSDKKPKIVQKGSPSGILWVGALVLGYEVTRDSRYLDIARKAADYYYEKFISKGLLFGGELDQDFSPDASSAAHAMASFCLLYKATKESKYLEYAKKSADIYSTFIMGDNIYFNPSSWAAQKSWTSLGMSTSGARNNHITSGCWPGFTEYLVEIYRYAKDPYYLDIAQDQYQASLQGYARFEGDITGVPGMGVIKTGYGFDWILNSDWCGDERLWFGGIMHLGMFHQTYIPALNWIPVEEKYGSVLIDCSLREAVSFDSLIIKEMDFKDDSISVLIVNKGINDETYKFSVLGLSTGQYHVYKDGKRIARFDVNDPELPAFFKAKHNSNETGKYLILGNSQK